MNDRELFFSSDYSLTELKERASGRGMNIKEFLLAAINKSVYDYSKGQEKTIELLVDVGNNVKTPL